MYFDISIMIFKYLYKIVAFLLTILISLAVLPNLSIYFRPNLILIFLIILLFQENLLFNLPFWILGGLVLDISRGNLLGASSFILLGLLVIAFFISKIIDFEIKTTQTILGTLFICLYYLVLFCLYWRVFKILPWNILINSLWTFLIFSLINYLCRQNTKNQKLT